MKRGHAWLLLVALCAGGLGYALSWKLHNGSLGRAQASAEDLIGHPAPVFELQDLRQQVQSLDNFSGRLILINFWATWCAPCRREMPLLADLADQHAERLVVLGIALDGPIKVAQFAAEFDINYPILLTGEDGFDLLRRYGNVEGLLPYSVLIDSAGVVRAYQFGELSEADLNEWLSMY